MKSSKSIFMVSKLIQHQFYKNAYNLYHSNYLLTLKLKETVPQPDVSVTFDPKSGTVPLSTNVGQIDWITGLLKSWVHFVRSCELIFALGANIFSFFSSIRSRLSFGFKIKKRNRVIEKLFEIRKKVWIEFLSSWFFLIIGLVYFIMLEDKWVIKGFGFLSLIPVIYGS